jgi:hypothetical protein
VNDPADVAVEALPVRLPVTLPVKFAVIVPAVKLPDPSRLTIVDAVFALVAPLARLAPVATLAAVTPPTLATTVAPCVPVTSPLSEPVSDPAEVAVDALPVKFAVIVPAVKLPEPSRLTIVDAVFALVAVLAKLAPAATFAAVTPLTLATVGLGKFPPKSPPATPVGARPDAHPKVPDPFVART